MCRTVCVCVPDHTYMGICTFTHDCRCPQRPEMSDPLELKLQTAVSCLTQTLGTGRPTSALNTEPSLQSQTLSLLHCGIFFCFYMIATMPWFFLFEIKKHITYFVFYKSLQFKKHFGFFKEILNFF